MTTSVTLNKTGPIARVTLNRPDRKNAFDRPMWHALTRCFADIAADPDLRCVLLTGNGGAFSTGADIAEFVHQRADPKQAEEYGHTMEEAYRAVGECPIPVVAGIDGPCTGAGMVLALLADIRIAGAGARFGAPVSRLGISMPYPEFSVLFEAVGRARSLDLVLRARLIDAAEAQIWGIVTQVVADDAVGDTALQAAEAITEGPPLVHLAHRSLARRLGTGEPLTAEERTETYASFATDDYREGIRAFLEKRRPAFAGR